MQSLYCGFIHKSKLDMKMIWFVYFFSSIPSHPATSTDQHTELYYTNLTLLKLGEETAVLVWPRAHPSLMPASLASSSVHASLQIALLLSLPPTLLLKTTPHPFFNIYSSFHLTSLSALPPVHPSMFRLKSSPPLFLPLGYQKTTCTASVEKVEWRVPANQSSWIDFFFFKIELNRVHILMVCVGYWWDQRDDQNSVFQSRFLVIFVFFFSQSSFGNYFLNPSCEASPCTLDKKK